MLAALQVTLSVMPCPRCFDPFVCADHILERSLTYAVLKRLDVASMNLDIMLLRVQLGVANTFYVVEKELRQGVVTLNRFHLIRHGTFPPYVGVFPQGPLPFRRRRLRRFSSLSRLLI